MRRITAVLLLALCLGCTSRYQVRGIEEPREEPIQLSEFIVDETVKQEDKDKEIARARAVQIATEHRSVETFKDFKIGILEIGDDGLVNTKQKTQVVDLVTSEMKNGGLVVVFVHGWHHGPRTCDRDLCCFRRVMDHIATNRRTVPGKENQNVVGIYIGWRGEAIAKRGVNIVTIKNRKTVAERIGRTAGKEFLLELHDMWARNPSMKLVSVGHSLGGAFLFKAAKGKMSGNVADIENNPNRSYRIPRARCDREQALARDRKAIRAGIGDLMVLVNPAIEASEYTPFDKDLWDKDFATASRQTLVEARLPYDKSQKYDDGQLPVLVTLASKADTAVGTIFPIAQYLTGHTGAAARGMGRYAPHVTHQLTSKNEPLTRDEKKDRKSRDRLAESCDCSMQADEIVPPDGSLDLTKEKYEQSFGDYKLKVDDARKARGWDWRSPYYVIQTSSKIAAEHSDIFNKEFVGFLVAFIDAFERMPSYNCNRGCPGPATPLQACKVGEQTVQSSVTSSK